MAVIDDDHIALVFDKPVWELFRGRATERGNLATEMIADAVAGLLGPLSRGGPTTIDQQRPILEPPVGPLVSAGGFRFGAPSGPLFLAARSHAVTFVTDRQVACMNTYHVRVRKSTPLIKEDHIQFQILEHKLRDYGFQPCGRQADGSKKPGDHAQRSLPFVVRL